VPDTNSDIIDKLSRNIASIESGGSKNPYQALGPNVPGRGQAIGKYQVMPENIPGWTLAATGRSMTPDQFRASPEAQEAVFRDQMQRHLQLYGPKDAASIWFTGRPYNVAGGNVTDRYKSNASYTLQATQGIDNANKVPGITITSTPAAATAPIVASTGTRNQLGQPTGQPATPPETSLASNAPAAPAQPQSWWEKATTNQKDAQGNEKPGTSPLAKLGADASKITQAPQVGEMPQPQQAPDTSMAIYPMASQLFQQTLANASKPLTWSSAPYGSGQAGQQMAALTPYAAPAMQSGPQIPGMTLNSLGMGYGYYG
jgi:hypothetical protein